MKEIAQLIKLAENQFGLRLELLIIDTLSRTMAGGDENSSTAMGTYVRNIDAIRATTGAHVLLVHHTGKDAARGARGHSLLRAATDTELEVIRPENATIGTLRTTKQRDRELARDIEFELTKVVIGVGPELESISSCAVKFYESANRPPRLKENERLMLAAFEQALSDKGDVFSPISTREWDAAAKKIDWSSGETRGRHPAKGANTDFPAPPSGKSLGNYRKSLQEKKYVQKTQKNQWVRVKVDNLENSGK
jgi:hypothetical protein